MTGPEKAGGLVAILVAVAVISFFFDGGWIGTILILVPAIFLLDKMMESGEEEDPG